MAEAMGRWDSLTFGRLNQDFHAAVYDACPNPPLVDLLRELARKLDAIRRTTFVHIPYRGDAAVQEHHALIALIRDGAADDVVEAAARQHKLNTLETFRRAREEEQR